MLEGRVLKSDHGTFGLAPWNGNNDSGIAPLSDKVLVRVDQALSKVGSIHITADTSDRQTLASTTGVMVAMGPQAFTWNNDRTVRWEGERPAVGTRVCFQRYAGQEYTGLDGLLYRVLDDRAIAGTMGMAEREATPATITAAAVATPKRRKAA